jgi:hypothetical protein
MMEDGEIYSVSAAESYGDYKAASLTRPAYIHEWIKDNINLAQIEKFHAVYDNGLRAILFFMVTTGNTEVDTCLAYFIDRGAQRGWAILQNETYTSGYDCSCSAQVREGVGDWKIYTGGYGGYVWSLNESSRNDNGNPFYGGITTPWLSMEDARISKRFDNLFIVTSEDNYNLLANYSVDGTYIGQLSLSTSASGTKLDDFMLDDDYLAESSIADNIGRIGIIGKRIKFEIFNSELNEDFIMSQLLIDFIPTGANI